MWYCWSCISSISTQSGRLSPILSVACVSATESIVCDCVSRCFRIHRTLRYLYVYIYKTTNDTSSCGGDGDNDDDGSNGDIQSISFHFRHSIYEKRRRRRKLSLFSRFLHGKHLHSSPIAVKERECHKKKTPHILTAYTQTPHSIFQPKYAKIRCRVCAKWKYNNFSLCTIFPQKLTNGGFCIESFWFIN